jgi:hypothetical protein
MNGYAVYLALGRNFPADNVTDNAIFIGGNKAHAKVGADV